MPLKIPTIQVGLEKSIQKAVKNVSARGGLNLSLNDKNFTRPLGKITGSVSEFNKSLEASNARVLAFGASVGMIQGVQSAFKALLQTTIQVENQLTEINIVMGLTNSQLDDFSKGLFKVAKNTAQSFSTVATAATELARQGLTMEETLKRTNDALILTRLTGLDAASAVNGLTAALNTFNKAGLDSTQILSKMAAVDVQFAVSTEDLIDAVSRAGAVAQDAGVSFDELLGAVTAAQQMTARGGKVIGNSFKTIFTRVQRSSTINRLEELGIAVRDVAGNTLPAIRVLENLSATYDKLADTTKAAVAEQVGGVFQINILKAAINDLSSSNSILARATQISASASDEAYKKNEILNRSLAALSSQAATSITELSNIIGDIGFSNQIRDYLTFIRDQVSSINDFLGQKEGESAGADFAKGLIKGIGNVISGPGLLLAAGVLIKLFAKTSTFLVGSAKELMGVVSASQRQKQVQESIVAVLGENSSLQKRILAQEGNRAAQEKTILTLLQAQSREQQRIAAAAKAVGPAVLRAGFNTSLQRGGKIASSGLIPNYVTPKEKEMEKQGAKDGGYTPGTVKSMDIKGRGRIIYNTAEKVKKFPGMSEPAILPPWQSKAGRKYKDTFEETHGFNPYANKGMIPNYSKSRSNITFKEMGGGQIGGPPRQVLFKSTVGGEKFTEAQTMEIIDPKNGAKMGLQVIFTGDSPPEMRGKGYGRELYEYMAKYAKRNGYGGLYGDMGTSISAMRVVDSIGKRKSFKVEKNPDLKFIKDDFEEEGIWASDDWTYRLSNKGLIPNYGAFSHDKNLLGSLLANDFAKDGRIKYLDALSYIDEKGLTSILKSFNKYGEHDGWKASWPGMPVNQLMKNFPRYSTDGKPYDSGTKGLYGGLTSTRIKEILEKPEITRQFYKYITGKISSIDMESGLTPQEKDYFKSNFGMIPKLKHIEDGFVSSGANQKKKNLDALRHDFLTAKPKGGSSTMSKIKTQFKGTLFKDPKRRANLFRQNNELAPDPILQLPYDPNRKHIDPNIRMAQPGDYLKAQHLKLEQEMMGSQSGIVRGASFRASDMGRVRSALSFNTSARDYQNKFLLNEFEALMQGEEGKRDPMSFSKAERRISGRLKVNPRIRSFYENMTRATRSRWGFSGGMIPNFGLKINAGAMKSIGLQSTLGQAKSRQEGVIGMAELDKILQSNLFKSIKYLPLKSDTPIMIKNARYGVHSLKKGAPPPKGFKSWKDFDENSPLGKTRVVYAKPKTESEKPFKRLRLERIESINHQGKTLTVDPNLANNGLIPNFIFKKLKTVSQAVKTFKEDTGTFSAGTRNNIWSTTENKIKLRASNYDDVRQFVNSKSFRLLDPAEQKRIKSDLKAQSESLNMNDVTRPYFQYDDPDYQGAIHANKGLIPNYSKLFSEGAKNVLSKSPQYTGAVQEAIQREASFGLTPKVVEAPSLKSSKNPGLAVVNQEQESGSLQKARILHGGLNPNQKSSAVPNYAKTQVDVTKVLQLRKESVRNIDDLGLNSISKSFNRAANIIDQFSTSVKSAQSYLNQQGTEYAKSSELIKEANLREKARLGTLGKETEARKKYMREVFRKDALTKLSSRSGPVGELATQFMGSSNFEKDLKFRMGVAQEANDFETLKGLQKFDKALDESARGMFNNAATKASILNNQLRESAKDGNKLKRFQGTEGFGKREMRKFFSQSFLQERGIQTLDSKEAMNIMASMGPRGEKAFQDYVKSQGVMSSNKTLARAGLRTGDFSSLLGGNDGKNFIKQLEKYQRMVDSDARGKSTARRELMREAARIGADSASSEKLQSMVLSTQRQVKDDAPRGAPQSARDRISGGRISGALGSFQSGMSGSGLRSQGFMGLVGNRAGQGLNRFGTGAKNFMKGGFGAAGGQMGLGLSIAAPMLAGMVANQTAREDRAVLQNGQFNVQGTGADTASSTLMGVGMGAIFGAPGAIVGGVIGFVQSLTKATLTIDEQIRVREKEIAVIGQNIQAAQSLQNLSTARAEAFAVGDSDRIAEIDTAMNRALAGVNDKKTLTALAASGGDSDALSKIQRQLQDQMTNAVSVQNFGVALKNSDQQKAAKNAGVAMGGIIAQAIRNENVDESTALDILRNIQTSTAEKEKSGMLDTKSLNALRKKASGGVFGGQELTSTGGMTGGLVGGLMAGGAALSMSGVGLPLGLAMMAAGAGVGMLSGRAIESGFARSDLEKQQKLGLDEINELSKLVDAGAMTETAMNQLVAAFREGEISMGDIAKEAESAVVEFQKIKKASDRASSALFNIDQSFKRTIGKMVVDLEVSKIRSAAESNARRSNVNFTSQFMSPTTASDFLAREQSKILASDAQNRVGQFQRETDINFLRGVQSKSKSLNFGGPQMEFVRKTVEDQGVGSIESMIRRREMSGVMNLNLNTKNLDDIFEKVGVKGGVDAFNKDSKITMPENLNELKDLLGTGDKDQQKRIMDEIVANLPKVRQEGSMQTKFTRALEGADVQTLTEIIDLRKEQFRVVQEQILAERKNLSIQIAQQKIQTQIQAKLENLRQESSNRSMALDTNMIGVRGRADTNRSLASFEAQSPIFRGMSSDAEESKRQASLRKRVFDEDIKVRKAEALNMLKKEAARLLSEKNLVDALNDLKSAIQKETDFAATEGNQVGTQKGQQIPVKAGPSSAASSASGAGAGKSPAVKMGKQMSSFKTSGNNEEGSKRIKEIGKEIDQNNIEIKTQESKLNTERTVEGRLLGDLEKYKGVLNQLENLKNLPENKVSFSSPGNVFKRNEREDSRESAIRKLEDMDLGRFAKVTESRFDSFDGFDSGDSGGGGYVQTTRDATDAEMIKSMRDLVGKTESQLQETRGKKGSAESAIEKAKSEIEEQKKQIEEIERQMAEGVVELSDTLKGQNISLENINVEKTANLTKDLFKADSIEGLTDTLNKNLEDIKANDPSGQIALQLQGWGELVKNVGASLDDAVRAFNVEEAKRAQEEFNRNLTFSNYSSGAFEQLNAINQGKKTIRAGVGVGIMDKVVDQERRQLNFDTINQDPTSTALERARAKAELQSFTIGTKDQRDQMGNLRNEQALQNRNLIDAERDRLNAVSAGKAAKTDEEKNAAKSAEESAVARIAELKGTIENLDKSMLDLAHQMERTTPRDKGFVSEFKQNTSMGLELGFAEIEAQSEQIYTRLGQDLPMVFRDGLVDAMQAALDGSQKLGDSFRQIGMSLLQNIQKAFLTSASNRITGAVGSIFGLDGYNTGGYVNGGSGIKDDVPAMLMGGEYVIKRSAVQKYGVNFLENLNQGNIQGFAGGGAVLNIGSPMVAERESYVDKSKYGNVTRYKTKQAGIGISSQLTGYAIANDRSIQKYFRDQETQFNQDLNTKKQEQARQRNKDYEKKAKKRSFWNMIIGIAGSALLGKAVQWGTDKFKQTDFYKNRAAAKAERSMADNGYVQVRGKSIQQLYPKPSDQSSVRKMISNAHRDGGWKAATTIMRDNNIRGTVDETGVSLNKGGAVPARLTGGEYVMSPGAVKTYGSSLMQNLNNGSIKTGGQSGQSGQVSNVSHGDVNISINVDNSGASSGGDLNSSEFASKVKSAVMNIIAQEKRVGGSLR